MFQTKTVSVIFVLMLAFVLFLSACGNSGNAIQSDASSSSGASQGSALQSGADNSGRPAADTVELVTFQADNGDIQVPRQPKRIVDMTAFYTGYFVALDAPLVGALSGALANPYLKGKVDGVQNLGEKPTLESILALEPDLIIAYTGTEGLEKLVDIAPVVAVEYGKRNYKDQLLAFGKLTNKDTEAKAWVDNWERKINELKPNVQEAVGDKTVSILNPYSKGLYVFGHNYGRGGEIIYGEFGLQAPKRAQQEAINSGTGWASISLETLPEFAGDIIFTCPWSGDTSDPKIVYDNVLWTGLPAVKAGNVFQLNPSADTYNDPVSLEAQLDFISTSLLSAK